MHKLLIEQLNQHCGGLNNLPKNLRSLVQAVDEAYNELDCPQNESSLKLLDQIPAVVYSCELDASRRFEYVSAQIKSMLGYEPIDWSGDFAFWVSHLHPDDRQTVHRAVEHTRATGDALRVEYRLIARDGRVVWVRDEANLIEQPDGRKLLQGLFYDISERKLNEEKLLQDAMHDPLTSLPNRALLLDRIVRAIAIRKRDPQKIYAVLCMDLDRFKTINDSIGHAIGDQLLVEFANRLKQILRPGDTVARLGGDEFAVLVEEVPSLEQVNSIADRIHQMLNTPFFLSGVEIFTTSSIGVAMGGRSIHTRTGYSA